jgi:hypothetical protein
VLMVLWKTFEVSSFLTHFYGNASFQSYYSIIMDGRRGMSGIDRVDFMGIVSEQYQVISTFSLQGNIRSNTKASPGFQMSLWRQ